MVTLLVRVSEEMADELKDLAETRGVSRKSLAIEGIRLVLEKYGKAV